MTGRAIPTGSPADAIPLAAQDRHRSAMFTCLAQPQVPPAVADALGGGQDHYDRVAGAIRPRLAEAFKSVAAEFNGIYSDDPN